MSTAVIKTGGKQYIVSPGDILKVEKLDAQEGDTVTFPVLLSTDASGEKVEIGTPELSQTATATVLKQDRDKKISVVKYKSKTRYKRNVGHRQPFTQVKIEKIG